MRAIDRTGTFFRLPYSCMKIVLEVVHHVQLTAKNFNSISLIYFIYYWQVIHTQWLLNPQPHSTPYSYKGGGVIWTTAYWQISNTSSLYVTSLWLFKAFSLFNWWCSGCFLSQSLNFCVIFDSMKASAFTTCPTLTCWQWIRTLRCSNVCF